MRYGTKPNIHQVIKLILFIIFSASNYRDSWYDEREV